MSLPDYYKILQVPVNATFAEIKASYRRLAKRYHPDASSTPGDEERFKQIKEAYEHLANPQKRARYDAKRNRATTFSEPARKSPGKKSYAFTEQEAKRRQYYQEHYKKAYDSGKKKTAPSQPPANKQPNELRYILISVPVAVALLLLIIRIYEKPKAETDALTFAEQLTDSGSEIGTSEVPYKALFGPMPADTSSLPVIQFVNKSGHDALVFLRNDSNRTVRHHFIENNFQLFAEQLPRGQYHLYYWLGDSFSYKRFTFETIMGNFSQTISVDSGKQRVRVVPARTDTFYFMLENRQRADTALLRQIFFPFY